MSRNVPNWFEAYLSYTGESESPTLFHKWVAASVIAGVLQRDTYIEMGYFMIYPNMYVVLISPPGRCRKSTAMRIGKDLQDKVPGQSFTSDSTSRERLILDLAQAYQDGQSAMTIHSTELASMLSTSQMSMVEFLTDIYDSPTEWTHKTKSGGTNKIKFPCVNMLAATTPDWMARALPFDTVGIGLTSRIVFVYGDKTIARIPFPELSTHQKLLKPMMIDDLTQISMISGRYDLSFDAKARHSEWYLNENEIPDDTRLAGYFERKPFHVLKLAMVVQASMNDELVISLDAYEYALAMLNETDPHLESVFAAVGKNPLSAEYSTVMSAILKAGQTGIVKGELLASFMHNLDDEQFDSVLNSLIMIGHIKMVGNKFVAQLENL